MAVERYIAICRPLHHVHICTVQRAHALIALIWVVSFIPALVEVFIILATQPLSVFSTSVICYHANMYNTKYHKVHSAVVEVEYRSVPSDIRLSCLLSHFLASSG